MRIPHSRRIGPVVAAFCAAFPAACAMDAPVDDHEAGIVEIVATGTTFSGPGSVPSGWTRVRFVNQSGEVHFVAIEKMPEGRGLEDLRDSVVPFYQEAMDLLTAGRFDEALARLGVVPDWFSQVVFHGGPGLTAPGQTSEVVVNLEPGTYVLECYVKNPEGRIHSAMGMLHELTVTSDSSGVAEPTATMDLHIANTGFTIDGEPTAGDHVVAVHFDEQMVHGNMLGSDVHLVRLADDTDMDALAAWMNAATPAGMATPAPAAFVTGIEEMPAGTTGYIDVELTPGEYAWIAEVDDPASKGMLQTFTVR